MGRMKILVPTSSTTPDTSKQGVKGKILPN
jgi:hypothetical protein